MNRILFSLVISFWLSLINTQTFNPENQSENSGKKDFLVKNTCADTVTCIQNQFGNDPSATILKCVNKISTCDAACQAALQTFQNCSEACACPSLDAEFPWSCLDACDKAAGSQPLSQLVDCIYGPCRPSSSMAWIIILIVVLVLGVLGGAGFAFYKYKQNKTPVLDTEGAFNKLNA
jgi:hypothetical protein